ncbi:hypothetical protein LUZ60_001049 [Juncus effusus]|nr:hypothetical protein LUZ60_001049 [Juncus effusus]
MAREKDIESRGRSSKRRRRSLSSSPSPSPSSSSSSYSSQSPEPHSRKTKSKSKHRKSSRHEESSRRSSKKSKSRRRKDYYREKGKRRSKKKHGDDSSDYSSMDEDNVEKKVLEANEIVMEILEVFPNLAQQLHQILEMIDNGQGVDLTDISDKSLAKLLKRLFISLNLEKNKKGVFMVSPKSVPILDIVGPTLIQFIKPSQLNDEEIRNETNDDVANKEEEKEEEQAPSPPKRRVIGPAMPSRELLEAAAELTQANDLLREAEVEEDGVLIGPPPPALVAEAESANEAERFEEVTRIMGADAESPYDVLGINWKMAPDNMKKKYWKLSLLVHPDKCSHPHAQQAFVILNKAFKDLQDPNIRGAIDDKLKAKDEQEKFEVELKSMREAAQWRKLQGITMEGDEELLAVSAPKEEPKRDEWMTTLPPERKAGMVTTMHSTTSFSRTAKEGRGDTSAWTDSPLDKANKAKQNYLEAYDRAKAIADAEQEKKQQQQTKTPGGYASLVDEYTSSKISLVEKNRQEKRKKEKKKHKKEETERGEREKGEWEGNHPWKPWDREKDLTAGRQSVNFDPKNMSKDLGSRFSAGPTQRNFL